MLAWYLLWASVCVFHRLVVISWVVADPGKSLILELHSPDSETPGIWYMSLKVLENDRPATSFEHFSLLRITM